MVDYLSKYHNATKITFEFKDVYVAPVGMGWMGILAKGDFSIDNEILFSKKPLELTVTAYDLFVGIKKVLKTGKDSGEYFCCDCGDSGCAYIWWGMALKDNLFLIEMTDLIEKPIGKQFYSVPKTSLIDAVIYLFNTIIEKWKVNGIVIRHDYGSDC